MVRMYITLFLSLACPFLYGQVNDTSANDDHLMIDFIDWSAPVFKGDLALFIKENVQYPESARKDSLEGRVIISYWIDTAGITINHKVLRSIRKDLDEEALRVTKLIHYEKPAIRNEKPIRVRFVVPVYFKLKEKGKKVKSKGKPG